jgi:hypothetical protein
MYVRRSRRLLNNSGDYCGNKQVAAAGFEPYSFIDRRRSIGMWERLIRTIWKIKDNMKT